MMTNRIFAVENKKNPTAVSQYGHSAPLSGSLHQGHYVKKFQKQTLILQSFSLANLQTNKQTNFPSSIYHDCQSVNELL